ncbi:MAG: hypothetical protein AB7E23_02840 [Bacilli bacterium]|jgi:hypothetical protein
MPIIVEAKGLRYKIVLLDNEIRIKENANLLDNVGNALKKINIFKKDKDILIDVSYKLSEISKSSFEDITQDTSRLILILSDGSVKAFEMSPTDIKQSNALKTHVKQIVDYIQSKK